ncbi:hypothetical protein OF83DRAFT_1097295 [Amylostereum chailletii]|nr:hypothetical protein OF83DRAFT_1097295 [Amylostereum chailletii]
MSSKALVAPALADISDIPLSPFTFSNSMRTARLKPNGQKNHFQMASCPSSPPLTVTLAPLPSSLTTQYRHQKTRSLFHPPPSTILPYSSHRYPRLLMTTTAISPPHPRPFVPPPPVGLLSQRRPLPRPVHRAPPDVLQPPNSASRSWQHSQLPWAVHVHSTSKTSICRQRTGGNGDPIPSTKESPWGSRLHGDVEGIKPVRGTFLLIAGGNSLISSRSRLSIWTSLRPPHHHQSRFTLRLHPDDSSKCILCTSKLYHAHSLPLLLWVSLLALQIGTIVFIHRPLPAPHTFPARTLYLSILCMYVR